MKTENQRYSEKKQGWEEDGSEKGSQQEAREGLRLKPKRMDSHLVISLGAWLEALLASEMVE